MQGRSVLTGGDSSPPRRSLGARVPSRAGHPSGSLYAVRHTCQEVPCPPSSDPKVLPGRVAKEKMTEEQAGLARENISFTPKLEVAVKEADYVIEAILESLKIKREIFAELDRLAPEHAVLATNSSRIVSSRIADATRRPSKVLNLHFNMDNG